MRCSHEQIIARLDESARLFRILIIKTAMTIPYTSIFFELECGYSSAETEERLRFDNAALGKQLTHWFSPKSSRAFTEFRIASH